VQGGQGDVTGQVVGLPLVLFPNPRDLVLQGEVSGRGQPGQAEVAALAVAERRALIDPRIGENLPAAQGRAPRAILIRPRCRHAVPPAQPSYSMTTPRSMMASGSAPPLPLQRLSDDDAGGVRLFIGAKAGRPHLPGAKLASRRSVRRGAR